MDVAFFEGEVERDIVGLTTIALAVEAIRTATRNRQGCEALLSTGLGYF